MRKSLLLSILLYSSLATSVVAQDLVDVEGSEIAAFPASMQDALLGVVDGDPVILGGWTAAGDSVSWSDDAYTIGGSQQWQQIASVDASRPGAATISVGNDLLVVGGRDRDTGSWSTPATLLRRGDNGLDASALPDLPTPLAHVAGTAVGQSITVAGFAPVGSTTLRVYTLNTASAQPSWRDLPETSAAAVGDLLVAVQNEGTFVSILPETDPTLLLHRYHPVDGWTNQASPATSIRPIAAWPMGQAHVGFLAPGPSADGAPGQTLAAYSTVTDSWSDAGHWSGERDNAIGFVHGTSLIVASGGADGSPPTLARASFDVGKRPFYVIDYAMVVVYLLGMILIGFYFSRREEGTDDFFVGGRKMPWWAVGFSLYATGTSAISFMAIPAKSYATDWLYLTQNAIGLIAIIPVALVIVPLIRRLSITSTYEYLGMRFHVVIRLMGSILAIIYQLGARMSVVLFLPALALSAVTGVGVVTSILFMGLIATLYTVLGGIKAVIWTDVVQVVVLLGGALLCLVIIVTGIDGGVGGLLSVASADAKMHMFDWRLDLTIPTVWLFLILATTDTITWPRDQVMVQRVLSTKSAKEAGFSVWTLALIVIPGSVLFFSLGTALYGFYKINPEKLSPLLDLDATFPFFIAAELPPGLAGLIIAALFAASMSTLDSSMNSVSTIIVVDFYKRFKKAVTDEACLRLAKWITVITGVFGTVFALILSRYSLPSLWDTFIMLTGLLGGGFGGVYALGMFTRRANWQGALVGIVSSIVVTLIVKEYTNIHVLLYAGVAITTCIVVGYLVSLFFPMQEKSLKGLTVYAQDAPAPAP